MNTIVLNEDHIKSIMTELERRIDLDIADGTIPMNHRYIREELATRMQGVYGTIMVLVPNDNWREIVWWLDDELDKLYIHYGLTVDVADSTYDYDEDGE